MHLPCPLSRAPRRAGVAAACGRGRLAAALLAALLALGLPGARGAEPAPPIAAAADLQYALPELVARFRARTGLAVRPSFGSSGNFRRQIEQGAPFELFLSADEGYVRALAAAGRTVDGGVRYARGRICLYAPRGSPLDPGRGLAGLGEALEAGAIARFAIANPAHAPYGRAAREALEDAGLWARIEERLVLGENAAQAAQFAASGSSAGGIIALALARAPALARRGRCAPIAEERHRPLNQRMVLIRGAGTTARRFYAFVQGAEARALLARHGFRPPE